MAKSSGSGGRGKQREIDRLRELYKITDYLADRLAGKRGVTKYRNDLVRIGKELEELGAKPTN